jgi:hypothetical protein
VVSGWADAGRDSLGGSAEAHTGPTGTATGAAVASMKVEKRITIEPGASGLAPGTLVTGLLWELDGEGVIEVGGRTHPASTESGAGAYLDLLVLRGPTGTCGDFDCPHGALAVAAHLQTSLYFATTVPGAPGERTASVTRQHSWSASNNAGALKAGAVFDSGSDSGELGGLVTEQDVWVARSVVVDTGGSPLDLAAIEFEANVGETLRVQVDLDASGSVEGAGFGRTDFFDSFGGRVVDPLARGLVFESSVPVPEPSRAALLLLGAAALALRAGRRPGPGRRRTGPHARRAAAG